MLHINTKNPSNTDTTSSSKLLFAFKPRQVLLAEHNRRGNMAACASKEEKSSKITSLTPEIKAILHQSILHYLHRNGFSKTSKRFQSEAEIQSDTWKASLLHLEDIFCKYNASNPDTNLNTINKPELGNDEATNEETTTKKKKKKGTIESDNGATEDQSKVTDKKTVESNKNFGQISEDIVVNEPETKPKKKKKTKHDSSSSGQAEEAKPDVNETLNGSEIDDLKKKTKEKKKKGIQQDKLESSDTTKNEIVTEVADKEKKKKKKPNTDTAVEDDENEGVQPDVTKKEKGSKKRKRSGSDENDNLPTELIINEESKRQKKEQKSKKEGIDAQETSNKEIDGQANGKPEINGGEKSGSQKSTKKQHNGSAEPKTVNAFQRVKIDQVEFAHEKLQDNSYWAKDGAEIGYGAKAQEVLGQVRGRNFRHEKTKKKRGSYRGGLIDLETRSVKFNYSDEE